MASLPESSLWNKLFSRSASFLALLPTLPLLFSLLSTRIELLLLEELTAALCKCQAVWLLVSSFKEETWACKHSLLRYDYALDHSSYRHLPTICFGRAELINGARSMRRRKTLGNSYATLKYLIWIKISNMCCLLSKLSKTLCQGRTARGPEQRNEKLTISSCWMR